MGGSNIGGQKGKEVGNWDLRLNRGKKEEKTLYSRISKREELVSVVWEWEVGFKAQNYPH